MNNSKMSQIAIINQSTVVSDVDGATMTSAMNLVLPQFCRDWKLQTYTALYVAKTKTTSIALRVYIRDTSDVQGALGYHELQSNDAPIGYCFAKTILLDAGGVVLYSTNTLVTTVAQCLCHEIFEMLVDPLANLWADIGDGETLYAYETGDPVESNIVKVVVTTTTSTTKPAGIYNGRFESAKTTNTVTNTNVGLSDWILPAWFDPVNTRGPFNHNRTLRSPFTIDSYGYAIKSVGGNVSYVFGDNVSSAKKAFVANKHRVALRSKSNLLVHEQSLPQ
jgi:hypothetical protein